MYTVFNCGIGMVLIVDNTVCDDVIDLLKQDGENAWQLGKVSNRVDLNSPQVTFA